MNVFVADPHWGWWIVFYFFLGGIAAGAYFAATLIDLAGREQDRALARSGYWTAFLLVSVCGALLIADLDKPGRFWHMLFRSEVVYEAFRQDWPWTAASWRLMTQAPLLKHWSPMSIGSWALSLFGACSALSCLGSLWPTGRLAWLLRGSILGRALLLLGCAVGFFVAAYTGALLTATNQPTWSDSTWIAPLFLTSAASTGTAALILLAAWRKAAPRESIHRLERADQVALLLELVVFVVFLASLGTMLQWVATTWHGILLIAGTLVVAILLPLALHLRSARLGRDPALAAAGLALAGGFLMRYAILGTPPDILARTPKAVPSAASQLGETERSTWLPHFSPEEGRTPGTTGADPGNRPDPLQPRSKVFHDE